MGEPRGANDNKEMCIVKLAGHRGSSDSHSPIEGVGGQPIYSMIQTSVFTYDESVEWDNLRVRYAGAFEMAGDVRVRPGSRVNTQRIVVADQIQTAHSYDSRTLLKYHNNRLCQSTASLCMQIVHNHTARSCDIYFACTALNCAYYPVLRLGTMGGYVVIMGFLGFRL